MSRRFTLTLLVVALLGGCSLPETGTSRAEPSTTTAQPARNVIELDVTGTATISSLTLVVDGSSSEEKAVVLPWHRTFEFPVGSGGHEWKLVVRYDAGSVHATCIANGRLLTETAGSSSGGSDSSAELSGSITP